MQRIRKKYDIKPVLHFRNETHRLTNNDDDSTTDLEGDHFPIAAKLDPVWSHHVQSCNNDDDTNSDEAYSRIPPTTDTPHDKCTSKPFGPAPPPDHPRYKPRYDHFSHPTPPCPKVTADDATNDTESTVDDATDTTDIELNDNLDRKFDDDDDSEFYL